MCGKTFTVTQQDDEESSTTTARLSNTSQQVMVLVSMTSYTFITCPVKSGPTPDFIIFVVSGWGLNLERDVLLSKCGSKGWSRLHITCLYGMAEFYTRFLYRWTYTKKHAQTGENTGKCVHTVISDHRLVHWQLSIKWRCWESKSISYGFEFYSNNLCMPAKWVQRQSVQRATV